MCRMLAVAGQDIEPQLLKEFQALAVTGKIRAGMEPGHNDGWGIAGFQKLDAVYFGRSADSAHLDGRYIKTAEAVVQSQSPLFLAHIRKATGGEVNLNNTHPFIKDGWLFAHNGTIYESEKLPIGNASLEGTTDSERFFAFLIEYISREIAARKLDRGHPFEKGVSPMIRKAIKFVKESCDYTSLTFLLANKNFLIAYRDFNEKSPEADEFEKYYTLYHHKNPDIICSEPIGNLKFVSLRNKELFVTSL